MPDDLQYTLPFPEPGENEGIFDAQLGLPLTPAPWVEGLSEIIKRDGRKEPFDKAKIASAILNSARQAGIEDRDLADSLASAVTIFIGKQLNGAPPTADQVSDAVERVLMQLSQPETALAYARYRDRRARIRRLRKGDMRALLGELEEARLERESAQAIETTLQVRTSQDSLVKWDRNRIVQALRLETGLEADIAGLIAAEVEKQIQDAGISVLTAPLIRELVGAKLLEHGLVEENEMRRRLGVPLYDASKIIRGTASETLGATPALTDHALARAVKKEYALSEVFSSEVTTAHLSGSLYLAGLDYVDRLYEADFSIAAVVAGSVAGVECPGGMASSPIHPAMLVARMIQFTRAMEAFFIESPRWVAFNHLVAPAFGNASDTELLEFARVVMQEFDFRMCQSNGIKNPERLSLHWSVPDALEDASALLGRECEGKETYAAWGDMARRLAWKFLDVLEEGILGNAFRAPRLEMALEPALFRHFEGVAFLRRAVRASLKRAGICFVLPERIPDGFSPAVLRSGACLEKGVWSRVCLNLPGISLKEDNEESFHDKLKHQCGLAVKAHREKRNFIEGLLDSTRNAPLSPLAISGEDAFLGNGLFCIDVDGLYECSEIMVGNRRSDHNERMAFMDRTLVFLGEVVKQAALSEKMDIVLGANTNLLASKRFAALDIAASANALKDIIRVEPSTQEVAYTTGIALAESCELTPFDKAKAEGMFHRRLAGTLLTRINLPLRNASEYTVADLMKKIMYQTDCRGVVLNVQ